MKQIEKRFLDVVFKQRCVSCKGFVFLVNTEEVCEKKVEGIIICPDCKTKSKMCFYVNGRIE